MNITLNWAGPFVLEPKTSTNAVVNTKLGSQSGLYLWTVECDGGFLVNYVGQTVRPFTKRFEEHQNWSFFRGPEHLVDIEKFKQGVRCRIGSSSPVAVGTPEFNHMMETYRCYRVFLAPLAQRSDILESIEAGIINTLRAGDAKQVAFLWNKRASRPPGPGIQVVMTTPAPIHGLPSVLNC
jgi:hypothetical protein